MLEILILFFFVKDCFKIDIQRLGPKIENYKLFPERINVTFAQMLDKNIIKVNVWERGAGQTKPAWYCGLRCYSGSYKKRSNR